MPTSPAEQQLCLLLTGFSAIFADISVEFAGGKKSRVPNPFLCGISV
jgi:hypothetical protein